MDDSVQVRCPKCKGTFRDSARRLQAGYSRQCPSCEVVLFFEDSSPNKDILRALKNAKELRRKLNQEAEEAEEKKRTIRYLRPR